MSKWEMIIKTKVVKYVAWCRCEKYKK